LAELNFFNAFSSFVYNGIKFFYQSANSFSTSSSTDVELLLAFVALLLVDAPVVLFEDEFDGVELLEFDDAFVVVAVVLEVGVEFEVDEFETGVVEFEEFEFEVELVVVVEDEFVEVLESVVALDVVVVFDAGAVVVVVVVVELEV
jgi:hypothetical protein